jgi:hypothetical protein
VLATAFVLVAPRVSDDFAFLTHEPLTAVAYVASVVGWGVLALQDAALTATRRAPWVLFKNGLFGALKLLVLPLLFVLGSAHGPFIAWVIPMFALIVPVHASPARSSGRPRLVRFLALDYLATVFTQTSLTILPLILIGILGSRATAHFYIPFTIALAFEVMFWSMTTSLVAEGALTPQRVPELVRLLVRRVAMIIGPVIAILVAAAPLVMLPFGEEYVRASTNVLRLLLCASLFRAAMLLAAAIWRLEGHGGRIAALEGFMLAGLLAAAIPLAHALGVIGVALAWLGSAVAIGCAVLPLLRRYMRSPPSAAPPPPAVGKRADDAGPRR